MFIRQLISFLLIVPLTVTAIKGAPARHDDISNQPEQEVLTPEEEREARALAEEFITRLEQTGDVTPLVKELFVSDFVERFRYRMVDLFPLTATPEVAAQMSSDDILRAHSASINSVYLGSRLYIEVQRKHELERAQRGDTSEHSKNQDPRIEELIPPSVIALIESDPALALLLEKAKRDEQEERRSSENNQTTHVATTSEEYRDMSPQPAESLEDFWPFKSIEQMRHYTSLTEQAIKLLREHIDSLPAQLKPPVREFMSELRKKSVDDEAETEDDIKPRSFVLDNERMGYSAGTHIICADDLIFHVEMVRGADGHLKVLDVHMVVD